MPSWTDMIDDCHNRVYPTSHPWGSVIKIELKQISI